MRKANLQTRLTALSNNAYNILITPAKRDSKLAI